MQAMQAMQAGISGIYRPGQWTAIPMEFEAIAESRERVASVSTLDGVGVRVTYAQAETKGARREWLYAVPGTADAPLAILDEDGRELYSGSFAGKAIEPKTPWVVTLGDTLGIELLGRNELLNKESSVAVSPIRDASGLPDNVIGYAGVDLVVITPSSASVLVAMQERQHEALRLWVQGGGQILVSLGGAATEILTVMPWLAERITGLNLGGAKSIKLDPSAIETFTSSQTRLPVLDAMELPPRGGDTRIAGRNTARQPARIAVDYSVGLGVATVVSVALDSPAIADWPQRSLLITRLSKRLLVSDSEVRRDSRVASAAVGYDDIAGQVRVALDRFDSRRRVPYSVVSLILILLVAMIGPIDYFLINRFLGRPLLGWITFPLSIFLVSGLLIWLGRPATTAAASSEDAVGSEGTSQSTAFINRLEIVDIDTTSPQAWGRGWSWSHVSTIDATKTDYPATLDPELYDASSEPAVLSAPFGYPGPTFGGISIIGEDRSMPSYEVTLRKGQGPFLASRITNIPISAGGSKGVVTQWNFMPKLSGKSDLSRRRGSELLEGRLTNPLPVDLLNGALVFGEWVYLLPTRLKAGQSIANVDTLRQKNFRWLLARREALENSSRSEPWDPEMHDDFQRLTEVLMFNAVAGGKDYTGLSNRPLKDLDLSHLLNQETAILFGQMEKPALRIDLPVQRASNSAVRVVLNVGIPKLTPSVATNSLTP